MFFYDLPSTILLLQQGREFFASDSDFPVPVSEKVSRAAYLTYGLLNSALQHLPQAYFHELLLLTLSRKLAEKHSPVPRVWQFPFPHTTALLLSGDSDWLGRAGLKRAWKKVLGWGGEYTQMIVMDDLNQFSAREIAEWKDRGIEFGLHYFCGYKPTPDDMRKHLSKARRLFLKKKLGFTSCRGHSIVWVGWDEQVKMMEEAGLDLSSNMLDYYHWGVSQGLPYPLYTKQGRSGIHELQIFSADDPTFFDKSGIPPIGPHEALLKMTGVLNVMNETYYQPLNALFHPAYFVSITPDSSEWIGGTIQHARRNSIPVMGVNRFFSSWKKRSELLRTCGRKIAPDSKTLERFGEFGVALPELWNGRRIKAEGKPLPGTGEILLPLKEAVKARYE